MKNLITTIALVAGFTNLASAFTNSSISSPPNTPPAYISSNSTDICENASGVIIEEITLYDSDFDAITIIDVTSTNSLIIDPSTVVFTSAGTPIGGQYFFNATASSGTSGIVDLEISFSDGIDTSTYIESISVIAPIQVNWVTTTNSLCNHNDFIDFSQLVDRPDGEFIENTNGTVFNDALMDVSTAPIGLSLSIEYVANDINGCETSSSNVFTVYESPSISFNVTDATCGGTNGEVTAAVISPNGSYSSSWNTGFTSATISNLTPGGYYLTVVDNIGCEVSEMASVAASDITINSVLSNPTCYNGSDGLIDLTITGPNAPYTVLWSTGSATEDATNATAGIYQAVISNNSGCEVTENYVLNNPVEPSLSATLAQPNCGVNDGNIFTSIPTGLSSPFTYTWSNSSTNQDLLNVGSGVYSVTIEDINNCQVVQEYVLNELNGPNVSGVVSRPNCGMNNGEIDATIFVPGGDALNSIQWSHGPTGEDATGLAPNIYTCTATTDNGCTSSKTWSISARAPQVNPICIVTVDSVSTTNLVVWEKVQPSGIDYYNIYRETAQSGVYVLIDTVKYDNLSVFNDVVASPSTKSWRYKISAVNDCGIEGPLSIAHKTVHLVTYTLAANPDVPVVVWDAYEGIQYSNVNLYRYSDQNDWEFIQNLANTIFEYEDVNAIGLTGLDYMIEITPSSVCTATTAKAQDYNSSRSNKAEGKFNPGNGTGDSNNSIGENNENFGVRVFPNPNSGLFFVNYENYVANSTAEIIILDLQGRILSTRKISSGMNKFDLSSAADGIYTVVVFDGEFKETMRVIKN